MLNARSPKYPGLYDRESGVRFRSGRAEVTEEQARLLAKRPVRDGILVEEILAKRWLQQQDGTSDGEPAVTEPQDAPPLPDDAQPPTITTDPAAEQGRGRTRKAT